MGPVLIVVVDVVADESVELSFVPDDGAVEELAADRSDPSLFGRVRDRNAHWCLEGLEAFGPKHLVEAGDEVASTVTDERAGACEKFGVAEEQVPRRLGRLRSCRVGCGAGEDDLAGAHVNEERDVVAAQERGVDCEEVAGHCCLGVQELAPCHIGSVRGDLVAEPGEFALDPAVFPCWVLIGEPYDQLADLRVDRRSAYTTGWLLGPMPGDPLAVPSQQRVRRDDPACSQRFGQSRCDRSQQAPIVIGECGPADLATEHGVFVA